MVAIATERIRFRSIPHAEQVLRTWLESLGNTSAEIAAGLEARGVLGCPHESSGCPLAEDAAGRFYATAFVNQVSANLMWGTPSLHASVDMPKAARDFVRDFDALRYPRLVRGAE